MKCIGPFGLPKVSKIKSLLAQSHEWMNHTTSEIHFFDVWRSEYERVREYNRVRGKAQRDRLGKAGVSALNKKYYYKFRDKNVEYSRSRRKAIKGDPDKMDRYREYCRKKNSGANGSGSIVQVKI